MLLLLAGCREEIPCWQTQARMCAEACVDEPRELREECAAVCYSDLLPYCDLVLE